MKYEWKKSEKQFYLPKNEPQLIVVPEYKFYSIEGRGNPNDVFFAEYIGILYSLSYAIKMSPKQGITPREYFEYTVYPLEGVWDIEEKVKESTNGSLDKDALVFDLMIRQPEFVTDEFASEIIGRTKKKKPHELLDKIKFKKIEEGRCIQMLHLGSYDSEQDSFQKMEEFTQEQNLKRCCHRHREIYISDARKVEPEKLKTVLRFQVA